MIVSVNRLEFYSFAVLFCFQLQFQFCNIFQFHFQLIEITLVICVEEQVLQNIDDLFEREELSAAPDVGWPDCFNSGVFVFRPSNATYASLLQFAITTGSFDGKLDISKYRRIFTAV